MQTTKGDKPKTDPINLIVMENDSILVALEDENSLIALTEQKYDTKTQGVCVAVSDEKYNKWLHKKVHWESYKDDASMPLNGKRYAAIKTKYVLFYEKEPVNE